MRYVFVAVLMCFASFALAATNNDNWANSYQLETQGKYSEALLVLEKEAASNDKNEFLWLRRAWLSYLSGAYNESIAHYKIAIKINPQSLDAVSGIMLPLMAQQRWREASVYGEEALKIDPLQYYANLRLFACEEALQQWQALFDRAQRITRYYPAAVDAWVYLGRAAAVLGSKATAIEAYKSVLQRMPGHLEAARYLAMAN